MYILGVSCYYHDSAACLLKDGMIVATAAEERFTRKKHDNSFPENAIKYCLDFEGIKINDVEYIGFYEKPFTKFGRILQTAIRTYPFGFWMFFKAVPEWLTTKLRLPSTIRKKLKYKGEVYFVDHHKSHAASTFYLSGFKEAAILTIDGIGEWNSTGLYYGKGNKILPLKNITFPHSLGLFYSTITAFLGFKVNNDEYKVMGLAAYGKPTYIEQLRKLIDIKEDGSIHLNMKYFSYEHKECMFSKKFIKEFGIPRKKGAKITARDKSLAASAQRLTEEVMLKMAQYAKELTKCKNLCIAGGVGLNSKANGVLLDKAGFDEIFFMPVAGDDGGSIGVAKYIWHSILGNKKAEKMEHAYYGPGFSDDEIETYFRENKIKFKKFKEQDLFEYTAEQVMKNKIVGWFQGRMEAGPRALGNRTIIANATNPKMKDIVNKRVKHREEFRPFAPAVLAEKAEEYFYITQDAPFMIYTTQVKEDKHNVIPATTHFDGSARPQTVRKDVNPRFWGVIKAFEDLTGVPVVMNTSFNVRGEPIVCTVEDAYKCAMGTGIDLLVAGKCVVDTR